MKAKKEKMPCIWVQITADDGKYSRTPLYSKLTEAEAIAEFDRMISLYKRMGVDFHNYSLLAGYLDENDNEIVERTIKEIKKASLELKA